MLVGMCLRIGVYVCESVDVYLSMFIWGCVGCLCVCACVLKGIHVRMCVRYRVCVGVCMRVCVDLFTRICICGCLCVGVCMC